VKINVVILAAGQGTRMRSALPKVLQPLAGRPMLAHVLATAAALEPHKLCVVHGHGGQQVRAAFADRPIDWVQQEPQLGTGHAVQQALPQLDSDAVALILYGDVPLVQQTTVERLTQAAAGGPAILTVVENDPAGYGRIVRDADGAVAAIVEEQDATPEQRALREVNTGLMAVPVRQLGPWLKALQADNAQQEYYLTDIVASAVASGVPVTAVAAAAPVEVMGINDKAQLAAAERAMQQRAASVLMHHGVTLADPARFDLRGTLTAGSDVTIDINVVFSGEVTLGDQVTIGPNCTISNSTIGPGSTIKANSVLEGATVGALCEVGPFARLRPQAELHDGARVGNFVELKNAVLGAGSKANHLTYLGDATIGSEVNVGCGTITCNYDGANKHRTVIGDGAFIGSGVELVAPVEVGAGATIGAGSTLGKDAPAGELTLERARQRTVSGWQRPQKDRC